MDEDQLFLSPTEAPRFPPGARYDLGDVRDDLDRIKTQLAPLAVSVRFWP